MAFQLFNINQGGAEALGQGVASIGQNINKAAELGEQYQTDYKAMSALAKSHPEIAQQMGFDSASTSPIQASKMFRGYVQYAQLGKQITEQQLQQAQLAKLQAQTGLISQMGGYGQQGQPKQEVPELSPAGQQAAIQGVQRLEMAKKVNNSLSLYDKLPSEDGSAGSLKDELMNKANDVLDTRKKLTDWAIQNKNKMQSDNPAYGDPFAPYLEKLGIKSAVGKTPTLPDDLMQKAQQVAKYASDPRIMEIVQSHGIAVPNTPSSANTNEFIKNRRISSNGTISESIGDTRLTNQPKNPISDNPYLAAQLIGGQ